MGSQRYFIKLLKNGNPLPAKVLESGNGYTQSGKPLNKYSAFAVKAFGSPSNVPNVDGVCSDEESAKKWKHKNKTNKNEDAKRCKKKKKKKVRFKLPPKQPKKPPTPLQDSHSNNSEKLDSENLDNSNDDNSENEEQRKEIEENIQNLKDSLDADASDSDQPIMGYSEKMILEQELSHNDCNDNVEDEKVSEKKMDNVCIGNNKQFFQKIDKLIDQLSNIEPPKSDKCKSEKKGTDNTKICKKRKLMKKAYKSEKNESENVSKKKLDK